MASSNYTSYSAEYAIISRPTLSQNAKPSLLKPSKTLGGDEHLQRRGKIRRRMSVKKTTKIKMMGYRKAEATTRRSQRSAAAQIPYDCEHRTKMELGMETIREQQHRSSHLPPDTLSISSPFWHPISSYSHNTCLLAVFFVVPHLTSCRCKLRG